MITTEWLALYEKNKEMIRNLVQSWHPCVNRLAHRQDRITAKRAESVCDIFRDEIRQDNSDPIMVLDEAVNKQDIAVAVRILNETWFGIPESHDSRSLDGFFILCDLCSEWDGDEYEPMKPLDHSIDCTCGHSDCPGVYLKR